MKTAMVWGADGGIGRAIVRVLRDDAWTVAAVARTSADLEQLTPYVYEADVARVRAVEQVVVEASHDVEQVDLWVYSAGDIAS